MPVPVKTSTHVLCQGFTGSQGTIHAAPGIICGLSMAGAEMIVKAIRG